MLLLLQYLSAVESSSALSGRHRQKMMMRVVKPPVCDQVTINKRIYFSFFFLLALLLLLMFFPALPMCVPAIHMQFFVTCFDANHTLNRRDATRVPVVRPSRLHFTWTTTTTTSTTTTGTLLSRYACAAQNCAPMQYCGETRGIAAFNSERNGQRCM